VKYLNPRAVLGIACLLRAAAYLTLVVLLHHGQTLDPRVWVNSLVQFQFFALGTMTAIVLRGRVPKHNFAHIAPPFLIALPRCLCLFSAFCNLPPGKLQRPFIYLGKISYGLYVYHVLCLGGSTLLVGRFEARGRLGPLTAELVAMAPALPATVAMAVLSYR
jgi:hypothetical protein